MHACTHAALNHGRSLTLLLLVLEASLITSRRCSPSPSRELIKPQGLQDVRVHTGVRRVPLVTLVYRGVASNEIHTTARQRSTNAAGTQQNAPKRGRKRTPANDKLRSRPALSETSLNTR